MEVIREFVKEVTNFKVGDKIKLGRYTATAVAKDEAGTTFIFDQVYGEKPVGSPIDERRANALYMSKAMDDVRMLLVPFTMKNGTEEFIFRSPTAEEMWPKQVLKGVIPTDIAGADKRWEYMKNVKNMLGYSVDGKPHPYWTCSVINYESPKAREGTNIYFVGDHLIDSCEKGHLDYDIFWRPVFKLRG